MPGFYKKRNKSLRSQKRGEDFDKLIIRFLIITFTVILLPWLLVKVTFF